MAVKMVKPDESFLQPACLASRKEVAAHLGKGIRTVQRSEGQIGLPVERSSGDRVRVSRSKLDRWLKDNWVSTRQQMPAANSGQRTFRISKLIEKCQQQKRRIGNPFRNCEKRPSVSLICAQKILKRFPCANISARNQGRLTRLTFPKPAAAGFRNISKSPASSPPEEQEGSLER